MPTIGPCWLLSKLDWKLIFLFISNTSFTGRFHLHMCLHVSYSSSFSLPNRLHCQFSYVYTKYIDHIRSPSPSLFTYTHTLVPSSGQDLFYLPVLHFLKCIFIVQGGLALVFYTCIYHTLIRLTSSILYSLLPCFPIIQQLSV
jgi:hypothetical protein